MTDNASVNTNTGATGATNISVATDNIGGVDYQRVKATFGIEGVATDVSATDPFPVIQTGTPALPTGAATEVTLAAVAASVDGLEGQVGALTETAPATDTASSGLNGRLQRIAQRLTSLIALVPASLGSKAAAASLAVTQSTEDAAQLGSLTETAPATDTASSGLNGRLQRIAQRVSSLIALVPASLGSKAASSSFAVTQSTEDAAQLGSLTETAPTTDTASSGLNGRLQRIAQRLTSLIALLPTSLATGGGLRATIQDTSGTALDYTVPALTGGDIAHGTAVGSSKPNMIAGRAATANPTANSDGTVTRIMTDDLGKVIAVSAVRDLKGVQTTTITSSTSETTIITAVASTFLDLYGLILTNSSASAQIATIKDATAGTTRLTIEIPAGDTRGFMLDAGSAIAQAVVNNNWTLTCTTSLASLYVTALYVKNI